MRSVYVCALVVLFAAAVSATVFDLSNEAETQRLFSSFVSKNHRVYGELEAQNRYAVFKANLARINELQAKSPRTQFGITKFADLSPEEFRAMYLSKNGVPQMSNAAFTFSATKSMKDMPTEWDWRTKNVVSPTKDQGQCGSCWAFSATEAIESAVAIKTGQLHVLAPQQIVDCDNKLGDEGCNGGWPNRAMEYVIATGGMEAETSYPYEGVDDRCRFDASKVVAKISSYANVSRDENSIQQALYENGPLSVALNAGPLQYYIGGIVEGNIITCNPDGIDHAVLMVGYRTAKDFGIVPQNVWVVRNSWGEDWGIEKGYFLLARGHNACGIDNVVTYPIA